MQRGINWSYCRSGKKLYLGLSEDEILSEDLRAWGYAHRKRIGRAKAQERTAKRGKCRYLDNQTKYIESKTRV